ncbi:unnamed protein product [Amoebophrya sp. A25]|nr:unnamed protein product [Amoebophrya sp. A25]|eukprot:GSA25T00008028001.1
MGIDYDDTGSETPAQAVASATFKSAVVNSVVQTYTTSGIAISASDVQDVDTRYESSDSSFLVEKRKKRRRSGESMLGRKNLQKLHSASSSSSTTSGSAHVSLNVKVPATASARGMTASSMGSALNTAALSSNLQKNAQAANPSMKVSKVDVDPPHVVTPPISAAVQHLEEGDGDISLRMSRGHYCAADKLTGFRRRGPCAQLLVENRNDRGSLGNGAITRTSTDISRYQCEDDCLNEAGCDAFSLDSRAYDSTGAVIQEDNLCCTLFANCTQLYGSAKANTDTQAMWSLLGYRVDRDSDKLTPEISSGVQKNADDVLNNHDIDSGEYFVTATEGTDVVRQYWRLPFENPSYQLLRRIRIFDVEESTGLDGLDTGDTEIVILSGGAGDEQAEEVVWPVGGEGNKISAAGTDILLKPSRQARAIEVRSKRAKVALESVQIDAVDVDRVSTAAQAEFETVGNVIQLGAVSDLKHQVSSVVARMRSFYQDLLGR